MMSVREQKAIVFPLLDEVLKPLGFKRKNGTPIFYKYEVGDTVIWSFLHISRSSRIEMNNYIITFDQVERCIYNLSGLPTMATLESYSSKENLFRTVKDINPMLSDFYLSNKVRTEEQLVNWCHNTIDYFTGSGKDWVEKYSCIKTVNDELTEMFNNGSEAFISLLGGGMEHNFRFLVFSKLADDGLLKKKMEFVEKKIVNREEWLPVYEEFKLLLEKVEPLDKEQLESRIILPMQ